MINLKRLKTFVLVAELGSLSRAAKVIGATQSFISREITQLETLWGDKLFDRTGRGMALTQFGLHVLPQAQQLLRYAQELDTSVHDNAGIVSGDVRIGIIPSLARRIIVDLFSTLQVAAPGVRLFVVEEFTGHLEELLASGQIDMAVMNRYHRSVLPGEDVLGFVDSHLIGRADLPLMRQPRVSFRELDNLPLVLPPRPNGLRTLLDNTARQLGIRLNVVVEVNTQAAMTRIAATGRAFSFLPPMAVADEIVAGTLATVPVSQPAMPRTISLSLTPHHPLSKAARTVASTVRRIATDVLSREGPQGILVP